MDSLTHILSGALIGEVIAGKQLKKKAMLWGAIAQTIPDLDVISSLWMSPAESALAHRGFTHSFTFIILFAPLIAWLMKRMSKNSEMTFKRWTIFFAIELSAHILIDSLTTYGTAWFEPFSHYRVSFNVIFVADPFYTIWLLIPAVVLLILRSNKKSRMQWALSGLLFSTCYIGYCINNKSQVDAIVDKELSRQRVNASRIISTPSPLNSWLWYLIVESKDGFYTGYRSVFDKTDSIRFQFFSKNDSLLAGFEENKDLENLLRFSQGFHTIEDINDTLVYNDLRFGQILGWSDPHGEFVFHYYLQNPVSNVMVVQRGRFSKINRDAFNSLITRIEGN